ncbi:MAG: hypothetical protein EPGJADBJ_03904 [Saprospiraceae bacterium]|nr:hypothetical protein [Saprospiraceae bacterium]
MRRSLTAVLILGCFLFFPIIFSQTTPDPDTLKMRVAGLMEEKKYGEVLRLADPAISASADRGEWEKFTDYTIIAADALTELQDHTQARQRLRQAFVTLQNGGMGNTIIAANILGWEAFQSRMLQEYGDALQAYQAAIRIYEKNKFKGQSLAYAYKNVAQILLRYSNDRQSIPYFEAALRADTSRSQNAGVYAQLAKSYIFLDSFEAAERYYKLGCAEFQKSPSNIASLNDVGAALALHRNDWAAARTHTLDALKYYQEIPSKGDNRIRAFAALAEIAALQNNPRQAESYFRQAEAEGKKFYSGKSREMAKLYVETGLFYEQQRQTDRALAFYQKALVQAFPNFNSLNPGDNPPVEDAGLESQALRAAAAKAQALLKKAVAGVPGNGMTDLRLNAAHCFDLSFAVAARLRRTYGNDADKFALAASNRAAYDAAALNLWQLWKETGDNNQLARLFAFIEQSKAQALGDALQQQRALALTGIPDSLLEKENNLRLEAAIAAIDLKEKELSGDSTAIVHAKDIAFRQQKAYDDLLTGLKKQYPQFRQYNQADLTANLSVIQAALPDTTILFSWYDAGDRYLCAAVRRHGITAFEVKRDSLLARTLSGFLTTLADKNAQQSDPTSCFTASHTLFQKLFPDTFLAPDRSLVIAPDGLLCYLPFEALLTAPHTGSYGTAPYLLRSKTVQYVWSATLLTLPETGKPPKNGLLHIAPFADAARDGLAVLPNSLRDAPESAGAAVLNGAEATTTEFLKSAPRYNALHLSTHADAGGRDVPGIELYDRRLTLPEIYAQRLHASLVSLSACETGAGRFAEGEGVLSLARAFAYAGARSLVASHWQVNERSTADLFSAFYESLDAGLPKAEALRQAKLRYLASSLPDARKAPFHWAAFTLTGVDGRVVFEKNNLSVWFYAVGGLFLLAVLVQWLAPSFFSEKKFRDAA